MPTFTYPGVYIEELSSGVHTITGVATSIAAFIGWAPQGPTDRATLIESWADYQATFGGLDARSKLGYSVNQFFANGGTQAYIVRLVWDGSLPAAPGTNPTPSATAVAAGVGYATAAISAALGAIVSPPIPLSVGTPVLQSLSIGPTNLPPIPLGATLQFTANGKSSDGTSSALASAKWTSSNAGVFSINVNTGSATATGPGTAVLTATAGLISGTLTVTVTAAALTSITVTPAAFTLPVGQPQPATGPPLGPTQQLAATGNYFDGTSQDLTSVVTWSVPGGSDSLVTASGLAIAGVTAGSTTTISAKWVGVTGTVVITVGPAAAVLGISIQQHAPVATVGMPVNFTAVETSSDSPTPAPIAGTWNSSNPGVAMILPATVDATAVDTGSNTITRTS
jgi:phage tail sheath protein FI